MMHKNNIIHCDIKPQNFLIFQTGYTLPDMEKNDENETGSVDSSLDPNITLKVTDFGLAHIIPEGQNKTYMKFRAGTTEYKAPEVKDVNLSIIKF